MLYHPLHECDNIALQFQYRDVGYNETLAFTKLMQMEIFDVRSKTNGHV